MTAYVVRSSFPLSSTTVVIEGQEKVVAGPRVNEAKRRLLDSYHQICELHNTSRHFEALTSTMCTPSP